jgi:hypothetical protein
MIALMLNHARMKSLGYPINPVSVDRVAGVADGTKAGHFTAQSWHR